MGPGPKMPMTIDWGKFRRMTTEPAESISSQVPLSMGLKSRTSPDVSKIKTDLLGALSKASSSIAPFVSNITNSTRKPPRATYPVLDTTPNLQKVNLSGERNVVSRGTYAANASADRNVDGNTAEVIKAYNRGQEFNNLTSINERESNINIGVGNQQAMMDMQVRGMNTERINDYFTSNTAADIAHQREQSGNVANAMDKVVAIGNEKEKARVDTERFKVLSSLFSKSGVLDRQRSKWQESGMKDPLGMDYSDLTIKKYGGFLKPVPGIKVK